MELILLIKKSTTNKTAQDWINEMIILESKVLLRQTNKSISEIASERELAESTIRGHLAKGITEGKVSIHSHLSQKEIEEIGNLIQSKNGDIVLVRQEFPAKYDYGTLKMVANHLAKSEKE